MNYKEIVKNKLRKYNKDDVIIKEHAKVQVLFRGITLEEIKENVINQKRLDVVIRQEAERQNEEKYDCYFGYNPYMCHRYILVINSNCFVCTAIEVNRRWQEIANKNAKI